MNLNNKRRRFVRTSVKPEKKSWDNDWLRVIEFNKTQQGISVNKPYSQSAVVYRAVRSIAENIPQAHYKVFSGNDVVNNGPIVNLFNNPNGYMSRFELWEGIATYLNLSGEAFLFLNKSLGQRVGMSNSIPAEILLIDPRYMKQVIEKDELVGWIFNGKMPIELNEVIHLKLFNPYNPIRGLSPIESVMSELQADTAASKYNKVFFENNATPDGVVELDKDSPADIELLRQVKHEWYANHGGVDNSHKIAFLLGGMSYKSMGITQKEMDFINSRAFTRDAILAIFGVPKFVAGFMDKGEVNRSTADASVRHFWKNTLKPMLIRIQEKLQSDFFNKYAPELEGRFDFSMIEELRPDYKETLESAKALWSLGYTRNEVNERLKLEMPEDDEDGNIRYLPMNLMPVGEDEEPEPPQPATEPEEEERSAPIGRINKNIYSRRFIKAQGSVEKLFERKVKGHLMSVRKNILKMLNNKKELTPEQMEALAELRGIFDDSEIRIIEVVSPVYQEAAEQAASITYEALGVEGKEFIINETLLNARLNMVKGMNNTLYNQVKDSLFKGIKQGESISKLQNRVKETFNTTTNRAKVIARTETASLMNGTTNKIYEEEGVKRREWIAEPDARDSHASVNGEIRALSEVFSNGLMYPGDPSGPPEEVINCRCTIAPVVEI